METHQPEAPERAAVRDANRRGELHPAQRAGLERMLRRALHEEWKCLLGGAESLAEAARVWQQSHGQPANESPAPVNG